MAKIECERCKNDHSVCNSAMLYGVCLGKGICKYHGEADAEDDFHYSEFEPMEPYTHLYPLKTDLVYITKEDIEKIYKQGFIDGMCAFSWTFENESWVGAWRMAPMRLKLAIKHVIGMVGYRPEKLRY